MPCCWLLENHINNSTRYVVIIFIKRLPAFFIMATYKLVDGKTIMNSNIFVDKKIDVHEGERIRLIVTANAYIRKCVWIHTGR